MSFVSKAEAFIISEIKSTIMDRLHMGGSFLQQIPTVTIGGLPVAIKQGGGGLAGLGGALGAVISAVQQAGDIAALVQNPMGAIEGAVGGALTGVSGKLTAITGQLTGGQLSTLTTALSGVTTALSDFQAHTSNLSGLSSSINDAIPDFNKITSVGETIKGFGTDDATNFLSNTASALKSGNNLTEIKDKLNITVQEKMDQILKLDSMTPAGQTAISSIVSDINGILNTSKSSMDNIVSSDNHNYNEAANNLTASQDVIGLAGKFSDANSVSYSLFVNLGVAKPSTISAFDTAIRTSTSNQ